MMRHVAVLWIVLTGLCSACTKPAPAPQIVMAPAAVICPAPARPELPRIDGALPLDGPANIEALMTRDDMMRQYIHGLESAVECYQAQTRETDGYR